MAPTELTILMQSIWCQDPVVAHTVHGYVPPIVVVPQMPKSSAAMAEAIAGAIDTASAAILLLLRTLLWILLPPLRMLIS